MTFRHTSESAVGTKQHLLCCAVVALAGVLMSTAAFGVASASAALPEEVVGSVRSIVSPVTAPAAPTLPDAAPSTPSPPPAAPEAPQAPASPPPNPVTTLASSATKAVATVTGALADGGASQASKKAATVVSSTSSEGAKQVTPPAGSGPPAASPSGRGASAPTAEVGTVGDDAPASETATRKFAGPAAPPSITAAREAPLRRWFAYVWPAIAFGRGGVALGEREGAPSPTVSDVVRMLLAGAFPASATGGATVSRGTATRDAPHAAPNNTPLPEGREITFFVIFSFAALLAFLMSTLWVEVRSKYLYR